MTNLLHSDSMEASGAFHTPVPSHTTYMAAGGGTGTGTGMGTGAASSAGSSAVPASTGRVHAFVGLVGPRSVYEQVERASDNFATGDTVRVVWHGSSPASLAGVQAVLAADSPARIKAFAGT